MRVPGAFFSSVGWSIRSSRMKGSLTILLSIPLLALGATHAGPALSSSSIPPVPPVRSAEQVDTAPPPLPGGALTNLVSQLPANPAEASAQFDAANKLYDAGKYPEAAAAYLDLLRGGQASTALYFNLGNACFKTGHLGRAIAAYRLALRLDPRDPDVLANLRFTRAQVQGTSLLPTWPQRMLGKLSLTEWTWAAVIAVWVFFLLLTLRQVRPALKRSLHSSLLVEGLVALVLCGAFGAAYYEARANPVAIVVSSDAVVRQGPLDESKSVFTAHDGAELRVLDQKDNWLQVTTDSRHLGWLRRDEVLLTTEMAHKT